MTLLQLKQKNSRKPVKTLGFKGLSKIGLAISLQPPTVFPALYTHRCAQDSTENVLEETLNSFFTLFAGFGARRIFVKKSLYFRLNGLCK